MAQSLWLDEPRSTKVRPVDQAAPIEEGPSGPCHRKESQSKIKEPFRNETLTAYLDDELAREERDTLDAALAGDSLLEARLKSMELDKGKWRSPSISSFTFLKPWP